MRELGPDKGFIQLRHAVDVLNVQAVRHRVPVLFPLLIILVLLFVGGGEDLQDFLEVGIRVEVSDLGKF